MAADIARKRRTIGTRTLAHVIGHMAAFSMSASVIGAQSVVLSANQPRFFADAGAMGGVDTDGVVDGPAIGIGVGALLSPWSSLRFEWKLPKRRVSDSGSPGSTVYVHEMRRIASYSLLFAQRIGRYRGPHAEVMGGFSGLLYSSKGFSVVRLSRAGSVRDFTYDIDDEERTAVLTGGLDLVFPFTRRLDIAPQLRADVVALGALVRAGVTLRVHF